MDFVQFYLGNAPDHKGRMLGEIWRWSDEQLETGHDFIHILFPLIEPSQMVPTAPTLDATALAEFRTNETIKKNLLTSFRRMLRFYGFVLHDQTGDVSVAPDFCHRAINWLVAGDHNHWRITRMLKCLTACDLGNYARAFLGTLLSVGNLDKVTSESLKFWKEAMLPEVMGDKERLNSLIAKATESLKEAAPSSDLHECLQEAFLLAKDLGEESKVMRLKNLKYLSDAKEGFTDS